MMNFPAEDQHTVVIKDMRISSTSKPTKEEFNTFGNCVPVSAIPMLRMGALCFCGKSSVAALKLKVPSSFLIILKTRMASPFASHMINALQQQVR